MNQITISEEFQGLIRHELDVESLLRVTLEFVLSRCGPTNAAVFLPTSCGDYSLGAYVNYDCAKETVDVLLDHLANVAAPKFEEADGAVHLTDPRGLDTFLGTDARWLETNHVVGMSSRHDGECLAVLMFFRDPSLPFSRSMIEDLRTISDLFAGQLSRVVRIHNRHLPPEQWRAVGDGDDERDENGGMAA